ncbi:MAG: ABC transporter ATP-binding protein [Oscillospiraceae bacterium]|nr:ABC transporter ATP-binding protein [Oscillospiraceae bacterium]
MAKKARVNYILWIYQKIKKRIPVLLFYSALSAAVAYAGVRFSLTTKAVINSAVSGDRNGLTASGLFLIGLSLFRLFGNILNRILNVNLNESLERDFKYSILRSILRSDYSSICKFHSGDLVHRMDADAAAVYGSIMGLVGGLVSVTTSLISAVIALMQIAPGFTVLFGGIAIVLGSTAMLFKRALKQLSKDNSAANGRVSGFLHETISKLMVIQALDVSEELERRTEGTLNERWIVRRKQRNVRMMSQFGISVISSASYLVTMLWCASKLVSGQITYGDVTAMISLVTTVRTSATSLPQTMPRLFTISAACDRIMELEALPKQSEPDLKKSRALYDAMTGFTAEHLSFSYDRDPVMSDVSLTIPKGGLTVIVGQSGIGKSTLLKLLLGLYKTQAGTLTIDTPDGSVPVNRSTRGMFSYAPQGNFLLSGTIRENLTFTNPDATEEEIQAALHASALDEYVATLPLGLETVLMENGAGLSEGQAQRLSLARAIVSGAPVLLLDEVTSALDAATEKTVLERITALPGKTCIAVTHRPAALELADHIIEVTEKGMTISHCE